MIIIKRKDKRGKGPLLMDDNQGSKENETTNGYKQADKTKQELDKSPGPSRWAQAH